MDDNQTVPSETDCDPEEREPDEKEPTHENDTKGDGASGIPESENGKSKRKRLFLLILCFLLLIIVVLAIFFRSCHAVKPIQNPNGVVDGLPSEMDVGQVEEALQKQADASNWTFDINTTPTFEDGNAEGMLRIVNPPYNVYPIEVDIVLEDDGQMIFQSGRILPNQHIGNAKLATVLSKGKYPAKAEIRAYDPNTDEFLNKAYVKLQITINK